MSVTSVLADERLHARTTPLLSDAAAPTDPAVTNYYVAKTGSDSNAGTEAAPFLTIQKGLDRATNSGNTVYVSTGDYNEYLVTKASGTPSNPITLVSLGGEVSTRAIRVNDHTNITLDGLVFHKTQAAGVTWQSAIRIEAGAHNLTLRNIIIRDPPHLSRTNWTFNATSNSIYSASGSDWAAAGFEVGGKIRTGAASIEPYIFANMDQNFTILGITNDALYITGSLTTETNSTWSMIYASPSTHEGIQGIDMILTGSTSATNLTVTDTSVETFGIAVDLQGPGPITLSRLNVNSHAWAGIRVNANNVTVEDSFFTGTNFIFYSEREQNDVPHDGSPDQYDFRQGYIRSDGTTGSSVTFANNWFQHIDNPLGQIGTAAYGTNWLFASNVVVGVMKQWDGLSRLVNATFLNNTFYRVSYDSEGGSTGHALTHSGASGSILATNHISLRNVFVDIGDHSSTNAEGFYANANLSGGEFNSNFVASAESMGWAGKANFSESDEFGGNPLFMNQHDPLGPDGLPFTSDDGLKPLPTSPLALHGLGALAAVELTADTPISHFNLVPASYGWLDQTGTNFNTAWEVVPPFSRTDFVRPWTTPEAMGEVPLEILSDASESISGDWFTNSFKGIKQFRWTWGDGASDLRPMQSKTNSHVFLRDGSFTVALTTENFAGNTASAEREYRILPVDSYTGDIWHVTQNGNDTTGTGASGAPYRTISKAHSVAADGDKIAVWGGATPGAAGTFNFAEDLDMNRNVATTSIAIHGFGAQTDRFRVRHSNWTIWGFDIDNTAGSQGGIYVFQASDGGNFVNNKFHDIAAGGLAGGFYGAGTAGNPMDNSLNVKIIGNYFTNVMEPQIQIWGGSNWLVSATYAEDSKGEGDFIRPRGANHTIQDFYVENMNNGFSGGHPDIIQLDNQSGSGYWFKDILVQRGWAAGIPFRHLDSGAVTLTKTTNDPSVLSSAPFFASYMAEERMGMTIQFDHDANSGTADITLTITNYVSSTEVEVDSDWGQSTPVAFEVVDDDAQIAQIETGAFADQTSYTNMVIKNVVFQDIRATINDSNDGLKLSHVTAYKTPRVSPNITTGGGIRGSSWGTRYTNNIFFQINSNDVSASSGWYYRSTGTGNPGSNTTTYANHNLVYPAKTSGDWTENGNEANGINGSDPLFVDAPNLLLMLATNSPAYGAGANLSGNSGLEAVTDDFWGETRTVWSIGAFEFSELGQEAGDTTDPVVTITGPTSSATYNNGTTSTVTISGTASDNVGLTSVTGTYSGATSGTLSISGTTTWSAASVSINVGDTTFVVTATDSSGNTAQDTIVVTRTASGSNSTGRLQRGVLSSP